MRAFASSARSSIVYRTASSTPSMLLVLPFLTIALFACSDEDLSAQADNARDDWSVVVQPGGVVARIPPDWSADVYIPRDRNTVLWMAHQDLHGDSPLDDGELVGITVAKSTDPSWTIPNLPNHEDVRSVGGTRYPMFFRAVNDWSDLDDLSNVTMIYLAAGQWWYLTAWFDGEPPEYIDEMPDLFWEIIETIDHG